MRIKFFSSLLVSFSPLLLGLGSQAHPLNVGEDLPLHQIDPSISSGWQDTYNLTVGRCPYFYGNITKGREIIQYTCQLFCPDQPENNTAVQCISSAATKEQAESQGLLHNDNQGNLWSLGLCHCGQGENTSLLKRQTAPPPNITQHGYVSSYTETVNWPRPGIKKYMITSEYSSRDDKVVTRFGYTPGQGVLYVFEAWNSKDQTPNRLRLRDLCVGWYYLQGEPLATFYSVYFETVIEDNTEQALRQVREILHPGDNNTNIVLYAGETDPRRQWAWQRMMSALFVMSINRMLREYTAFGGRSIVALSMPGGNYLYDLEIVFSGTSSTELVEATRR